MFLVRVVREHKNDPTDVVLFGKGRIVIEWTQYAGEREYVRTRFNPECARNYGFKRECDAKRSAAYKLNKRYGMGVEIVEADC